jgi:hypothetical protein
MQASKVQASIRESIPGLRICYRRLREAGLNLSFPYTRPWARVGNQIILTDSGEVFTGLSYAQQPERLTK